MNILKCIKKYKTVVKNVFTNTSKLEINQKNKLVLIGKELDKDKILTQLNSCIEKEIQNINS